MTKLGLDYAALKAVNPKLIYCGTYGYGKDGPYGERGALDDSIQAVSGIAMLNEMVLGEPRYLPTVVCDKTTAMQVVSAVTAALFHRERSGRGPGDRGPHVRDDGVLHHGRAPVGHDLRAARSAAPATRG